MVCGDASSFSGFTFFSKGPRKVVSQNPNLFALRPAPGASELLATDEGPIEAEWLPREHPGGHREKLIASRNRGCPFYLSEVHIAGEAAQARKLRPSASAGRDVSLRMNQLSGTADF